MSILNYSGPGGGAPGGGVRGGHFKFLPSPEEKNTNSIISQKLRTARKKSFMQEVSVRSIPIDPGNLVTSEES